MHRILELQKSDIERCFPLMLELRPHLNLERFISLYDAAHKADHYTISAIELEGQIVALMGHRILHDYVHGRHLYIDDLITAKNHRSQGFGKIFLEHAEHLAKKFNCDNLRLCTGLDNAGGIKFYERNGWSKRSYAFKKKFT